MNNAHRNNILDKMDLLIASTDYHELMSLCLNQDIINDDMRAVIEEETDQRIRHQLLLKKITRRGPNAYAAFEKLLGTSFPAAFEILQNGNQPSLGGDLACVTNSDVLRSCFPFVFGGAESNHSDNDDSSPDDDIPLTEYQNQLPRVAFTVQISNQIHYHPRIGTYTMESKYRGVAFIVNIIKFDNKDPRNGARADRNNLVTLLRQMGIKVFYYEDLTKAQFLQLRDRLLKSPYLRSSECLIFAVLSHGNYDDRHLRVEFSDHELLNVERIITSFSSTNCPQLIGKPKIFIFPFCRGNEIHLGVTYRDVETDARGDYVPSGRSQSPPPTPEYTDIKILYGTLAGYVSNRHPVSGSHYIEVLCEIWAENAHDQELEHLMKMVDHKLRERKFNGRPGSLQVTGTENRGFNRALYFNPGYVKPSRL